VLDVTIQIAGALAAAHAGHIVHRDIKPENVIVRRDGIVKVLDFGVAKLTGQDPAADLDSETPTRAHARTDTGIVMGTAAYMSPEQARGLQVDARSDIFSVGVVLYELVAGCSPFGGASSYEVVAAILSDREAPPPRGVAGVPVEFERIVSKALRKNREERYQTVKDFLLDLQSLRQRVTSGTIDVPPARGEQPPAARNHSLRVYVVSGVVLLLVAVSIGFGLWKQAATPARSEIRSLAVLPLKSLDEGENYLGLGIADAAIRRISQTGKVIVRPTSAVRRYVAEDVDALTAARQLGVDSVLEGSLQHEADRLRVSFNLLRTQDGASLWSDSFEIKMADIFTVQDTVSQQVAARLRLQLDASQQAQLTKRYTSDPIAYEFYLKGAYNFGQRRRNAPQFMPVAIEFYKKAIAADGNFALAHAQLGYAYATQAVFLEPGEPAWVRLAKEEIGRAQQLDPQLAETHLARFQLAYSQFEGYQAETAVREALLANQLNPNVGHDELVYIYTHLGLEDLAQREFARALEIDPTSDGLNDSKLLMYEVQTRPDDYAADQRVRHNSRLDAWYLIGKRRFDEAQKVIERWPATESDSTRTPTRLLLLAARGDFAAAEAEIPAVLAKHPFKGPLYHHATYDIACVYAMQGKSAEAVKWLRESAVYGYHLYPRYTRDPFLDRIRQAPEFIQFVAAMKAENERYRREFP
jgi:TolB-like protein